MQEPNAAAEITTLTLGMSSSYYYRNQGFELMVFANRELFCELDRNFENFI